MYHPKVTRISGTRLRVQHPSDVPVTLFARPDVPLEGRAVDELLRLLDSQGDLPSPARLQRVALTPDFHRGSGIPVGTVLQADGFLLPGAVGNDVGCGMRLHLTSLRREDIAPHLDRLERRLRALFFEGGRQIAMTGRQRQALLQGGVGGLLGLPGTGGLWDGLARQDPQREQERCDHTAQLRTPWLSPPQLGALRDWIGAPDDLTYDSQIGSLGGGNHFAEVQVVHRIIDPRAAHQWGIREGLVTVMIHSGSLGVGHWAGQLAARTARDAWPAGLPRPRSGVFPVMQDAAPDALRAVQSALQMAANFAAVNRLWLGQMTRAGLEEACGETDFPLLYDAAHNFIWPEDGRWIHRKGAAPARGFAQMQDTPFAYTGEPVLVPGSMGASSFILAGRGNPEALWSASHGAGRQQARGDAMRGSQAEFSAFLEAFRVVTPLDWRRARPDIRERKRTELMQEAPFAYKGVGPVVETLREAGLAEPVAELRPLLTVKG